MRSVALELRQGSVCAILQLVDDCRLFVFARGRLPLLFVCGFGGVIVAERVLEEGWLGVVSAEVSAYTVRVHSFTARTL